MGILNPNHVTIRGVEVEDWQRLKDIRLEALRDAPLAFITTYEEALGHEDAFWRERASLGSAGKSQLTLIALAGERTVGLATGIRRDKPPTDVVPVVSVFVDRTARRTGVGDGLMSGIEEWARVGGASSTSLWVIEGNTDAERFYERRGYRRTLDRQKIDGDPPRWESRLELEFPSG